MQVEYAEYVDLFALTAGIASVLFAVIGLNTHGAGRLMSIVSLAAETITLLHLA
jgi:hypothetical protein